MPRFAANLSTLYAEHAFLDRYAAAAADGFDAVECQFPYAHERAEIAARLRDLGLTQVLINAPAGHLERGERGIACLPGREDEFRRGFADQALAYAQALGCTRVHVLAGIAPRGADRMRLRAQYEANLAWAAAQAASVGVEVLIEPINARDIPGYLLNYQDKAQRIVRDLGAPNLKVQMDLYHCQIVEGDLSMRLREHLPGGRVGHLQIAGVPDRQEPDRGEVRYPHLFALIDALGWAGWVGCEYHPRGATSAGLGWLQRWRARAGQADAA